VKLPLAPSLGVLPRASAARATTRSIRTARGRTTPPR
jgi:hypothetical protein